MSLCPHCGLPAELPAICTPELHEAIEREVAKSSALYMAGYEAGKRAALADLNRQLSEATSYIEHLEVHGNL